jgi:hypothetical protein
VGAHLDTPTMRANGLKAAEDSRSPKPRGMRRRFRQRDSVLDCGCPLRLLLQPVGAVVVSRCTLAVGAVQIVLDLEILGSQFGGVDKSKATMKR